MVPSTSARPPGTNVLAQGVSTRDLPYLFDELGGEYKKSLIHLPNRLPIIHKYLCLPLRRGSQAETRMLNLYYIPATQQKLTRFAFSRQNNYIQEKPLLNSSPRESACITR